MHPCPSVPEAVAGGRRPFGCRGHAVNVLRTPRSNLTPSFITRGQEERGHDADRLLCIVRSMGQGKSARRRPLPDADRSLRTNRGAARRTPRPSVCHKARQSPTMGATAITHPPPRNPVPCHRTGQGRAQHQHGLVAGNGDNPGNGVSDCLAEDERSDHIAQCGEHNGGARAGRARCDERRDRVGCIVQPRW